jgi:predicted dehydrogenase
VAHRQDGASCLGQMLRVDVRQSAGVRWPCVSPTAVSPSSGGGVLLSFGVHTLDLLLWWLGDLTPISYSDDALGGVEAECECDLLSADGTLVHVEISRRRSLRDTAVFECERGTIEVAVFEPAFIRMHLDADAPVLETHVADPEFEAAPLRTVFARQLLDFVHAIQDRREPLVNGQAGTRVVQLVERCYGMKRPLRRPWDYPSAYDSLRQAGRA